MDQFKFIGSLFKQGLPSEKDLLIIIIFFTILFFFLLSLFFYDYIVKKKREKQNFFTAMKKRGFEEKDIEYIYNALKKKYPYDLYVIEQNENICTEIMSEVAHKLGYNKEEYIKTAKQKLGFDREYLLEKYFKNRKDMLSKYNR